MGRHPSRARDDDDGGGFGVLPWRDRDGCGDAARWVGGGVCARVVV